MNTIKHHLIPVLFGVFLGIAIMLGMVYFLGFVDKMEEIRKIEQEQTEQIDKIYSTLDTNSTCEDIIPNK